MPNYYPAVQTPIPLRIYTDAGAPYTGAAPTLQVRKNRTGAPATATGTLTHAGSGIWDYTPAAGEVSAPCTFLMLTWSGAGIAQGHEAIEFETDYSSVVAGRIDVPISGVMVLHTGTAQAGSASTITLANAAIATDNIYLGETIQIVSGTGAGQVRVISGYVGATRVATVGRPWTAQPDATSVYRILPIQSPVLDNSLRVTVGTNADKTGYELSGTERTTLYNGIWANASRTLTAISDSAGVTTLLSRLTSTRAAYLDALTALTEGRMVWLERIGTALEETSVGSGLWRFTTLALSRLGIDVFAIKTRVELGVPNAAPGSPTGVVQKQDLPGAAPTVAQIADGVWDEALSGHTTAGSAGKALADAAISTSSSFAVLGMKLVVDGQDCDCETLPRLTVRKGDDRDVVLWVVDGDGRYLPIPSSVTPTLVNATGGNVDNAELIDIKAQVGYLKVRLSIPSTGTMPASLMLLFDGGPGATWTWEVLLTVA